LSGQGDSTLPPASLTKDTLPPAHPVEVQAAEHPPWTADRAWLDLWRKAGPLAEREPMLRAWLAVAPPQPLPRRLAAVELARIAREHGIEVKLQPQSGGLTEEQPTDEEGKAA
jgi:hypothetical protein